MTRQTDRPLEDLKLQSSGRPVGEIAENFAELRLDLNPPYQRGNVWSEDQKIALVRSWLTGTPTGVAIFNDRTTAAWVDANGSDPAESGIGMYACIDGKQRITTAQQWFTGKFAVPASWFAAEDVIATEDTDDGPYVRYPSLTEKRRRIFANRALLQVTEAKAATVQEEATVYLLVNGGGTPQTDSDITNAAGVAAQR